MAISDKDKVLLCRWAGIAVNDEASAEVAVACYERAAAWYENAGVPINNESKNWIMDLAAWFFDNRGRSEAEIPPYIVTSVHALRGGED